MTNLERIRNGLTPERRDKIALRAKEIVAEELSLQELRRAHKLTQEQLAESLGITQDQISKLEKRADVLVSTLRKYIEAAGGELVLVATFPDQHPIRVAGFSEFPLESKKNSVNTTESRKERHHLGPCTPAKLTRRG
ncbi:MAG: helix-turn-helix transcriptional regulator [Acidobacteriaceae bacterium]|nr:helix-turn-helix transcriptional regulator [Acidobacteriaceae bacterium]